MAAKKKTKKKSRKKKAPPPVTTAALARIEPPATQITQPAPRDALSVIPKIKETMANMERVRRFVSKALNIDLQRRIASLKPGEKLDDAERQALEVDWGTIPGMDKPFLKQPGAEKFCLWLGLRPKYTKREVDLGNGHIEMIASVTMYSKLTGEEVFEGPDCSCTTMESNYRFRWAEVEWDEKNKRPSDEVLEKKKMEGMGRWRKKAEWAKGKKVGEKWIWQERIENPNVYDERNKVRQMGEKRALVKCIRNMGAISEIFTADPSEWDIQDDDDDPRNDQDFTESGRRIVNADGTMPSGRPAPGFHHPHAETGERQKGPTAEQQKVADQIIEEKKRAIEETRKKQGEASQNVPPGSGPTTGASPKIVTITWAADLKTAAVSGDIAELVQWMQTELGATWSGTAWILDAARIADLVFPIQKVGFKIQEIKPPPPGKAPVPQKAVVKDVKPDQRTGSGAPNVQVLFAGIWCYCYDKPLFPYLEKSKGLECEFVFEKKNGPPKIIGLVRIGKQKFEADGRTPYTDRRDQ